MQVFAVLCLAAVALARPQNFKGDAVTTVTERSFTIRGQGEADKYYGTGFNGGVSSYSYAQPSYNYQTVASAVPNQYYSQYAQSAPAYSYQAAAPAYSYQAAAPAYAYQSASPAYAYQQAAPAYAYQQAAYQAAYQAAPVSYSAVTAAPAVAYETATAAPALAYQSAAPAVSSYSAVTAAPAVAYTAAPAVYQQAVGVRSEYENNYANNFQDGQIADTKIFKHVYAFAAPEEPSTRATVRVQAPVNKRKHYKLVFIKAPSQQSVVDSDITLPAQEEEKTLIYVLSKNQKQVQPEIRIKQAEASKHAKPEVFFLKYKNEAEAQAIANGAISGQNADVPAQGEIISDGSVSLLGQSSSADYNSGAYNSGAFASGSAFESSFRGSKAPVSNVIYRSGFPTAANAGLSAVSAGSVGIVSSPVVATTVSPIAVPVSGFASSPYGAGLSGGFSAYSGRSFGVVSDQEPASVAIKVSSEPTDVLEATTAGPL